MGRRVELTVQRMISGGMGLSRLDGKVCLIRGVLPGERVTAEITREKRDFCEGTLLDVREPSVYRIEPPCRWYRICGGCDFQYVSYAYQIELKREMLLDALRRGTGMQLSCEDIPMVSGPQWGYRRRVRLTSHPDTGRLGFRKPRSHGVAEIDSCMVLHESLQKYVGSQRTEKQVSLFAGDSQVSEGGRAVKVTLENAQGTGHAFRLDAEVFFQSNITLMPDVIDFVLQNPRGDCAMDLYSGVGTFAAFLADSYAHVTAVERDPRCLSYALQNLPKQVRFYTESAESWKKTSSHIDRLVVDPPRIGLHPEALKQILQWQPESIIYVSCSPVTCFRDLKHLIVGGYRFEGIIGADFYPQTAHIECAVFLQKAN